MALDFAPSDQVVYRPGRRPHVRSAPAPRRARRGWRSSAALVVVVGLLGIGLAAATGLLRLINPFTTSTHDRTNPALLTQLVDLSEYRAASAQLEVTVDIEHDVRYLPSAIAGERAIYQAIGTVDATVDFRGLAENGITTAADGTVTIVLPHAKLGKATLDLDRSKVMNRDRGLFNRLGGVFTDSPTSERALHQAAQAKLTAAAADSPVLARAESNTAQLVTALAQALGHQKVHVVFGSPAPSLDPTVTDGPAVTESPAVTETPAAE